MHTMIEIKEQLLTECNLAFKTDTLFSHIILKISVDVSICTFLCTYSVIIVPKYPP